DGGGRGGRSRPPTPSFHSSPVLWHLTQASAVPTFTVGSDLGQHEARPPREERTGRLILFTRRAPRPQQQRRGCTPMTVLTARAAVPTSTPERYAKQLL